MPPISTEIAVVSPFLTPLALIHVLAHFEPFFVRG
jgi:hypothetical protein